MIRMHKSSIIFQFVRHASVHATLLLTYLFGCKTIQLQDSILLPYLFDYKTGAYSSKIMAYIWISLV